MGGVYFFSKSAVAKETLPTRPQNIKNIKITCDVIFSVGVTPAVRPTVLIAEKVSIKESASVMGSIAQIINAPLNAKERLTRVISNALFKNSFLILFLKAVMLFLPRTEEKMKAKNTKKEVVLIPPAVEPELPPMNIKITVKSFDDSVREAISTVLNPAVLGVTALKKLLSNFVLKGIPLNKLLYSKAKNKSVPITSKAALVVKTILLCRFNFLNRKRFIVKSSHTRKPKPPKIISAEIISITNGSLLKAVSELNGVGFPNRSNPALQKAETEWKIP